MSASKALKSIVFTAKAEEHHVSVKIKSILRWLKSGNEIKVAINGKSDRQKSMEAILKHIEREIKSGAEIKQKVIKPESIKFSLRPTANAANYNLSDDDIKQEIGVDEMIEGKDLFSGDFEKELEESIKNDYSKRKK